MNSMGRFLRRYFNGWWLPLAIGLANLTGLTILVFPIIGTSSTISFVFLAAVSLLLVGTTFSFFGLLGSALWSLASRRWLKLCSDVLMTCLYLGLVYLSISLLLAASMNVGEENFSYGAIVPIARSVFHPMSDVEMIAAI